MACSSQSKRVTRPVWTNGTPSSANFIVFHRMRVEEWVKARASIIVEVASAAEMDMTVNARYAQQEQDLPAASLVSWTTTEQGDGTEYATTYTTLDESKHLVEIGVNASNSAGGGTRNEMALVTLIIDFQGA